MTALRQSFANGQSTIHPSIVGLLHGFRFLWPVQKRQRRKEQDEPAVRLTMIREEEDNVDKALAQIVDDDALDPVEPLRVLYRHCRAHPVASVRDLLNNATTTERWCPCRRRKTKRPLTKRMCRH
jgi:hypothetical protein